MTQAGPLPDPLPKGEGEKSLVRLKDRRPRLKPGPLCDLILASCLR
jgi:hypothetical protein